MVIATDLRAKTHYQRQLFSGAVEYLSEEPGATLYIPNSRLFNEEKPTAIDGILRVSYLKSNETLFRGLTTPSTSTVYLGQRQSADEHQIYVDHDAVCEMAFNHFRECGLHNFAFLNPQGNRTAAWRLAPFTTQCERAGYPLHVISFKTGQKMQDSPECQEALLNAPKPIGVFLSGNDLGPAITDFCTVLGLRIPQDVQIIGVHTHSRQATASSPQLSSIEIDAEKIGFEAAKKLVALIRGEQVDVVTKIRPETLVRRDSTARLTGLDPAVASALDFMHQNIAEDILMEDILAEQQVSRRSLELLFIQNVGKPPMKYLCDLRLKRMCHLLTTTDLSIVEIGRRCGLHNTTYLYRLFKKHHNMTPQQFRHAAS